METAESHYVNEHLGSILIFLTKVTNMHIFMYYSQLHKGNVVRGIVSLQKTLTNSINEQGG